MVLGQTNCWGSTGSKLSPKSWASQSLPRYPNAPSTASLQVNFLSVPHYISDLIHQFDSYNFFIQLIFLNCQICHCLRLIYFNIKAETHIIFPLWNWCISINQTSSFSEINQSKQYNCPSSPLPTQLSDLLLYCSQVCFSSDFDNFSHSFQNAFWGFQHDSQFLCQSSFWGKCMTYVSTVEVSFIAQNLRFGASFEACFNFTLKVSTVRGQFVSCNFLPRKSRWWSEKYFLSSKCCHALVWAKERG